MTPHDEIAEYAADRFGDGAVVDAVDDGMRARPDTPMGRKVFARLETVIAADDVIFGCDERHGYAGTKHKRRVRKNALIDDCMIGERERERERERA